MSKVFVVTEGLYSDYGIVGIFSTKEKAEEITNRPNRDCNEIEEYELDVLKPFSGWHIIMDKEGNTSKIYHHEYEAEKDYPQEFYTIWKFMNYKSQEKVKQLVGEYIKADDEQHAVKIMNEKRTFLIANNLWDDPTELTADREAIWLGVKVVI